MAEWEADLDPERVRFTHARIRPLFSDGRPVLETLAALRDGSLQLSELPKILVHERDGYYYSINNRRLWCAVGDTDTGTGVCQELILSAFFS